jgi:hypothetical protein
MSVDRNKRSVDYQLKTINDYIAASDQRLFLEESKGTHEGEVYHSLKWQHPHDEENDMVEHIRSGDYLDLSIALSAIQYGIRMQKLNK